VHKAVKDLVVHSSCLEKHDTVPVVVSTWSEPLATQCHCEVQWLSCCINMKVDSELLVISFCHRYSVNFY